MRWRRGSPSRSAGVLYILGWLLFIVLETILTPLLLPLIGYTFYRDQKKLGNQTKSQREPKGKIPECTDETKEQLELGQHDTDQTTNSPKETTEDGGDTKELSGRSSGDKDRSRDIFGMRTSTFPY